MVADPNDSEGVNYTKAPDLSVSVCSVSSVNSSACLNLKCDKTSDMDSPTTTEAKEKDTPTTISTDESHETTSESVKEYRSELKEVLESKPSSSENPASKSLNPDLVRDVSGPSAETEVREDAREHEPMREDARGERHESVDRDDAKHEDGSVGEPEEWKQAVDFAKELASEGKLEWFRTMMARIESG